MCAKFEPKQNKYGQWESAWCTAKSTHAVVNIPEYKSEIEPLPIYVYCETHAIEAQKTRFTDCIVLPLDRVSGKWQ